MCVLQAILNALELFDGLVGEGKLKSKKRWPRKQPVKVFVKLQKDVFVYAAIYIFLNYETYLSIMQTKSTLKIKMKTQ